MRVGGGGLGEGGGGRDDLAEEGEALGLAWPELVGLELFRFS